MKNIKSIIEGDTPPSNTNNYWFDTTTNTLKRFGANGWIGAVEPEKMTVTFTLEDGNVINKEVLCSIKNKTSYGESYSFSEIGTW